MAIKKIDATVGIYAGSFDPPTWGHVSIVERALGFCDRVVVAVATNTSKKSLFTAEERKIFWETILAEHSSRVKVVAFSGLTARLAKSEGARFLIRGLRSSGDLTREMEIAAAHFTLNDELETIFLGALPAYALHSSTIVREIAHFDRNADLSTYVPPIVSKALKQKLDR